MVSEKLPIFALANETCAPYGAIAQLVEQRTENPCVPGSIPGGTTQISQASFSTLDFNLKSRVFFMPISRLAGASALPVYQQMRPSPVQALSPISLLWFILSSVLYDAPHSWIQMQQTCLAYCFRPILHVFYHDKKGLRSR